MNSSSRVIRNEKTFRVLVKVTLTNSAVAREVVVEGPCSVFDRQPLVMPFMFTVVFVTLT